MGLVYGMYGSKKEGKGGVGREALTPLNTKTARGIEERTRVWCCLFSKEEKKRMIGRREKREEGREKGGEERGRGRGEGKRKMVGIRKGRMMEEGCEKRKR